MRMCPCERVQVFAHARMRVCACAFVRVCVCARARVCACARVRVRAHLRVYAARACGGRACAGAGARARSAGTGAGAHACACAPCGCKPSKGLVVPNKVTEIGGCVVGHQCLPAHNQLHTCTSLETIVAGEPGRAALSGHCSYDEKQE